MIALKFTERWPSEKFGALFQENVEKNCDFNVQTPYQFCFGSIIPKKQFELTEDLVGIYKKYTIVRPGDIMINGLNLNYDFVTQRVGLVKNEGIITSAYLSIRLKKDNNPNYYAYLLKTVDAQKIFHGLGTGIRKTLAYSDLKNFILPVPAKAEQEQISRYLDWQVSKINRLILSKKKEISLLDERQRSFVCNLVMNGVKPERKKKVSGINWSEEIPEDWDVLYLSQVSNERSVKNTGMVENNLLSLSYGHIINKDINTTEGLLPASFEGYQIVLPDNIVLRLTDLQNDHKSLRVGLSTQKGIITSAYTCLNAHDNILPEYLYLQLHAADLCKVFYGMGGGVRQSIGFKDIRKMLIAVPPLEEQKEIVSELKASNAPTEALIAKLNAEIKTLEELKTRIISDVVTGQLDVHNIEVPEYEYVEEEADDSESDEEDIDGESTEQEEE